MRGKALRKAVAFALGGLVVGLDQLTKAWALRALPDGESMTLIPGLLRLHVTENSGAAFSMLQGAGSFLVLAIVAAVVVILLAIRSSEGWWETLTLGLVLGGAIGNLIDRLTRGPGFSDGRVVDWIDPSFFPTFNVADASITTGVALLLLFGLLTRTDSAA